MPSEWIDYLGVCAFGGFVGLAELVSRYRDEPRRAISVTPSYLYIVINSFVALAALGLIRGYGWELGSSNPRLTQVLVAGFSAMAFLRTSLFTVRIGNQDIGIGPSIVVQALLRAIDGAVDRRRATQRDQAVTFIMQEVSFEKSYQLLPAHCLALMQNLSQEDEASLGREIEAIARMNSSDNAKARLLGLALMNLMGEKVVNTAVASLMTEIKRKQRS